MKIEKINCSVGILTFNEEKVLSRALDSVKDFDEIVICDGGSTDKTIEIAKKYGCKIIFQKGECKDSSGRLIDFSCARNQLFDTAKHDWFLFIDSDESFTKELVDEIRGVVEKTSEKPAAYWMKRKYVIDGEIIDCATTYPNKQMRFFHKDAVSYFVKKVHEKIQVNKDSVIEELENYMLVPMDGDIKFLREKWERYINIEHERLGDINILQWARIVYVNFKVSVLYILRLARNVLFCRGKRMPLILEFERHRYHLRLSIKLFRNIKLKS